MKRLQMTVEGQTEAAFAIDVLRPHLANYQVYLSPPRYTGLHKRRRGRIPQGGLLNTFNHALSDMKIWLRHDQSSDARFTMMIDLYSLPRDFPGYEVGSGKQTGKEQAETLEEALAIEMNDSRFIPYLQLHEYEALVLVEPGRMNTLYENARLGVQLLSDECAEFATPEDINHGQHSHPKYRIQKHVPDYDENVAGPLLAENIGLMILRDRCPHFGQWLSCLEQLDQ